MFKFHHKGDFGDTKKFFDRATRLDALSILNRYGRSGVSLLSGATPVDTGATSSSWSYEIKSQSGSVSVHWTNSEIAGGVPLVILLQYGHGTRGGGFVQGRDFINPAMRGIFDRMAEDVWREVIGK